LPLEPCDSSDEVDLNGNCIQPIDIAVSYIANCLYGNYSTRLSQSEINFLYSTTSSLEIKSYLENNSCSETAQTFTKLAIEALRENKDLGTENEVDFKKEIINELTGKALCIYNKLMASGTGFKNAIKNFDGEFPVSHLKFEESRNLPSNTNAETSPPKDFLITITVNSNNLNRPNLSIARTIIHETIHAEMFRKILSIIDNGGSLNGLTLSEWTAKLSNGDYPGIFDYYTRYGINGMQHQQMAAHYITTISNMLEELQPGLSQNIYYSLAWGGLQNTLAWAALSNSEKININNTINDFNEKGSENCN
jgi:hypothetical protein